MNPIDTVKSAAMAEVVQLRTAATSFEQKQVGWLRTNAKPLIIGAVAGVVLGILAGLIL